MGFLKQDAPVVDYEEWSQGHPRGEDRADGPALGRGRLRDARSCCTCSTSSRSCSTSWRLADRPDHQGHRRVHQRRVLVCRADRVREGRALHDAVRGRRARMRIRPAEQPVLPADGIDPVLVAAQDHSAATVAQPDTADQGHGSHAGRRAAVRGAAGDACGRVVLRRHRARSRRSARPSACCRCGRSGRSSACWRCSACATR